MIVADTSAIVAVLFDEEDATDYLDKFAGVEDVVISAASYVELNVVLQRRLRASATGMARRFVENTDIAIVPLSAGQAEIAAEAFRVYPILNFGDSFSYALAKDLDVALLFKGDDFALTYITRA